MVEDNLVITNVERIFTDEQHAAALADAPAKDTPAPHPPAKKEVTELAQNKADTQGDQTQQAKADAAEAAAKEVKSKEEAEAAQAKAAQEAEKEKGTTESRIKKIRERRRPAEFKPGEKGKEPEKEFTQDDYKALNAKYEEAQGVLQKPLIQAILKAEQKGESIIDYLADLQPTSLKNKSPEQVYEMGLRLRGVKSVDDPDYNTGDRSIEDEMKKFDDAPLSTQDDLVEKAKRQIQRQDEQRLQGLYDRANQPGESDETAQQIQSGLEGIVPAIVGKDHYGITVTQEMADQAVNSIYQDLIPRNSDGTVNTNELFLQRLTYQNLDVILDTFEKEVAAEATHKALDRVEATPDSAVHARPPQIQTLPKEGTEEYAQKLNEATWTRVRD